jgi:hypothetical protein
MQEQKIASVYQPIAAQPQPSTAISSPTSSNGYHTMSPPSSSTRRNSDTKESDGSATTNSDDDLPPSSPPTAHSQRNSPDAAAAAWTSSVGKGMQCPPGFEWMHNGKGFADFLEIKKELSHLVKKFPSFPKF